MKHAKLDSASYLVGSGSPLGADMMRDPPNSHNFRSVGQSEQLTIQLVADLYNMLASKSRPMITAPGDYSTAKP